MSSPHHHDGIPSKFLRFDIRSPSSVPHSGLFLLKIRARASCASKSLLQTEPKSLNGALHLLFFFLNCFVLLSVKYQMKQNCSSTVLRTSVRVPMSVVKYLSEPLNIFVIEIIYSRTLRLRSSPYRFYNSATVERPNAIY